MGLAAAAPMGPVNMLAIRRGVIGGWRHTLACGIGSITSDLILFSLVLFGGDFLFPDLSNPTLQAGLAAMGALVLLPLGIYFLVRAVKEPLRAYTSARQHWDEGTVPGHLIAEVADAAALTIFNPLTIAYWVGVTSNWRPGAHAVVGYCAPGLGILMATVGLMTWFTALTVIVPSPPPHRPELLPPRQRHPRPNPPWLRHVLYNSPVPPSPALRCRVPSTCGSPDK
jgi:threonine/homoserine/homoserine lactone efflux protein